MKCSSCAKNLCERKYANRHRCSGKDEKVSCTCTCQVSGTEEVLTSAASIGAGIAAAAGGVALTVVTGGLFAIVGGAALVGAGSSLILNPVQKQITGECMTLSDTVQDVALGATIGAITGPIGAGGSAMAKGASGMVKLGVRAGAGAIAGGVSGTVSETARLVKGEEVSLGSFAKAAGIGALAGTVGGASTHVASNVSKQVSNGVAKAATRIGVQATTAAATDAGLQYADKGTVDPKQLLLNTAGQITVATTAEVSQNMSKRTNAYVKAVDAEVLGDKIDAAKNEINSLPSDVIEKEISKAKMYTENQMVNDELKGRGPIAQKEFDFKNPNLSGPERAQMATEKQLHKNIEGNLNKLRNHIVKNSDKLSTISRPDLIGENKNIHALHGDRVGQFAYDLAPPDPTTGVRSSERAVFTMNENKASFTGYTKEHNYGDLQQNNRRPVLNPYDALRPENFRSNLPRDEEETKHKED